VDVVSDIETPAACMDLVYRELATYRSRSFMYWYIPGLTDTFLDNQTAHYEDLSFEYDQDTEVCSIWNSKFRLGIDYNRTAKSSVSIGNALGPCSVYMSSLDKAKKLLIFADSDKVGEGEGE
jgi:hypothetical protein